MRTMHPPVYFMKDIMVDIETLGTLPGSAILSIGAVAFDAETGEMGDEFLAKISPVSCSDFGMSVDMKTITWWMQQEDAARIEAFSGKLSIDTALFNFEEFLARRTVARLWAKPPSFDLVLIEDAYKRVSISLPWHYRSPRCVRTIMDVAGFEYGHTLPSHTALDDAKAQAIMVIESYALIRQRANAEGQ